MKKNCSLISLRNPETRRSFILYNCNLHSEHNLPMSCSSLAADALAKRGRIGFEDGERVCLSVKDIFVKRDNRGIRVGEEEILEDLSKEP